MAKTKVKHGDKYFIIECEGDIPTDAEIEAAISVAEKEEASKLKPVSQVTAMVIDNGCFLEMARTLGKVYKKVYYCCPSWVKSSPDIRNAYIGYGFDEIEVIRGVFDIPLDDIDVYVFTDIGHVGVQLHLEALGKKVWGGRTGEELEAKRVETKELLEKTGLPVGKYEVINGTPALREFLKRHDDQIVKMDCWRENGETFRSKSYDTTKYLIDEKDVQFGAFKDDVVEFIVEEALKDRVEVGYDGYCIDGEFPSKTLYGIEVKDLCYISKFTDYENIPEPVRRVNDKLVPTLKKAGYRQMFATEIRIGKDKKPYAIDFTTRQSSPPGELIQRFYTNLAEIVWHGANGELIAPKPASAWGAQIILQSDWSNHGWSPIKIPKEFSDYVFVKNGCIVDEQLYSMPQIGQDLPQICSVIGFDKTLESALEMAQEVAASIEGIYLDVPTGSLKQAEEEIEKAEKLGVWVKD